MSAWATSTLAPVRVAAPNSASRQATRSALRFVRGGARQREGEPATTTRPGHGISNLPGSLRQCSSEDELATGLMDLFRRTRSREVFDALIQLTREQLLTRVRARVRYVGKNVDPEELLQDAIINIYRYPDRFDARRAGAFRAWSSMIVDNSIRRHLRKQRAGVDLCYVPDDMLVQERDQASADPANRAVQNETSRGLARTFGLFLLLYMGAYEGLSERERFVLHMVEVNDMRYADLADVMSIRPEALKMVVFRARQRIQKKIAAVVACN